jgi:fumarate reductase flavoprotein subunit
MLSDAQTRKSQYSAELVVIGAGGAGLCAAVAAAEKGARVIVLEKANPGGSTARAVGFFAAESTVQKHAMIDATRDDAYRIAMQYGHLKTDPRIIRAFVDKSGDTVDWLMQKGVAIDMVTALYPAQHPLTCHIVNGGGARLIKLLRQQCDELGVRIFAKTPAQKIVTNHQGRIIEVSALGDDRKVAVSTGCVVIASGGYGGNPHLLKTYCPFYRESLKNIGAPNTGAGLEMALSMGAATEGLGILHLAGPYFNEKANLVLDQRKVLMPLGAIGFEPVALWVNQKGERFIDECVGGDHFESANAVIRQPEMVAYMIIDNAMVRTFETKGLEVGQGKYKAMQRKGLPGLSDALLKAHRKGNALVSESLGDIASFIGADPDVLKKTISDYNTCCDSGHDPIFNKNRRYLKALRTPPYYVMKGDVCFLGTIGGIKINHFMQVLNHQDDPIPGLYAAGSDTGGWTSDTYCGKLPGTTFGFALNSGRIAGEMAARFLKKASARER